ncbi:MAG TPA: electron transfer flavoprotein subunit alpha/FixB family protein [Bryobacteraceae bacterium]|jgi:electron transfer flavoprotein alpha subunit|nr:electron transfer flavoprotein subunit alpha/FixB family protein [Bryobacteraceae bacterium]
MSILVVMEQRAVQGPPAWSRMSWETLAAGQQLARELQQPVSAAVLGQGVENLAAELTGKKLDRAYLVEHELLKDYTPDTYATAVRQLVEKTQASIVLFPHTYQVRDFLPKLATALGRVAVSDVVAHRIEDGKLVLVRQLFQGKLNVDVRFTGEPPYFASLQAGAYRADQLEAGSAPLEKFTPQLSPSRIKPLDLFREAARAVDLTAAEIIVSVGRGIKEADNIPIVQKLADALGAELAASRPICDSGWLPMERQVGSSGQTVAPKMYLAVGISGAIQHLVGMKGSKTIVAINKDANAPIFEVADYGIVGDLFQVVPALVEEIKKAKR